MALMRSYRYAASVAFLALHDPSLGEQRTVPAFDCMDAVSCTTTDAALRPKRYHQSTAWIFCFHEKWRPVDITLMPNSDGIGGRCVLRSLLGGMVSRPSTCPAVPLRAPGASTLTRLGFRLQGRALLGASATGSQRPDPRHCVDLSGSPSPRPRPA